MCNYNYCNNELRHKSVSEGFLTFTFQNVSNFEKRTHLRVLCSRPCTWTTIPMSHRQNEINYDKNYIESRATCFWAVSTCSNHFDLFQPVSTHTKNWIWVCQKMIKNWSSNGLEISGIIWKSIPWLQFPCGESRDNNESNKMSSRLRRWSCSGSFCRALAALPGWTIRQHSMLRRGLGGGLGDSMW